jgi:hypothetical protein
MSKLVGFGDIHLSGYPRWHLEAGQRFIDWVKATDFGPKSDTELVLTGDVTNRDVLSGVVIDQLIELFDVLTSKFRHTWVCMGNHEPKRWHGEVQHPMMFLKNRADVTVVVKEERVTSKLGFKVLFMPYQRIIGKSIEAYYNELPAVLTLPYDAIVGHFAVKDEFLYKDGVDISGLTTKAWFLGHIHNRPSPEYLGSVYPVALGEDVCKYPRIYRVLNSDGKVTDVELPVFLEYKTITYPDKPVQNPNVTTVYTIKGLDNDVSARTAYPDIHLKGVERKKTEKDAKAIEAATQVFSSHTDALFAWANETANKPSRRSLALVSKLLNGD